MGDMKMIWCKCTDCGKEFYGKGHRTVCDDCKAKHQREWTKQYKARMKAEGKTNSLKRYKYTCRYCETVTHDSKEICSTCKEKYRLWGIIINMVKREKEKRDAGLERETPAD